MILEKEMMERGYYTSVENAKKIEKIIDRHWRKHNV